MLVCVPLIVMLHLPDMCQTINKKRSRDRSSSRPPKSALRDGSKSRERPFQVQWRPKSTNSHKIETVGDITPEQRQLLQCYIAALLLYLQVYMCLVAKLSQLRGIDVLDALL